MDTHHTVVDLATVSVPLPTGPHRFLATLGRPRFVHAANRVWMGVVPRHDLLTPVSQFLFIPTDRFQEALQGPRRGPESQGDGLGGLTMDIGQLSLNIDS